MADMLDILIVEDNKEISSLLCDFLRRQNYTVSVADSGTQALELFDRYGAKLVILDVVLPGLDGFSVCSKIRETNNTPILIVSARTERDDKLNVILLGADDYIEKPYDIDILLAKIDGIFKRRYAQDEIVEGNIRLDRVNSAAYVDGARLDMTAKEFDLLLLLVENKGRTLKKEYIFNRIWGSDSISEPQTLTVHVKRLREKLGKESADRIRTVWGVGYQFV